MTADNPFAGHNPAAVLLLAFSGLIVTASLGIHGLRRGVRTVRGRHRGLTAGLRTAGLWASVGALGVYTWGLLHLAVFDESLQADACHEALGSQTLAAYEPTYLPLTFGCVAGNGKTYDVAVPGYVNPAAGLLGVSAFLLTVFSFAGAHNHKKDAT